MTGAFTISGRRYTLDSRRIEAVLADELPEPIRDHFVIVGGRRFPPKQVLRAVTGLDRADFTTHQARRVLTRLGFLAGRASEPTQSTAEPARGPYGGRQAEALRPFVGRWVALGEPCEVLVAADSPQEVLAWLARHGRRATSGMFRVPEVRAGAEGVAPI